MNPYLVLGVALNSDDLTIRKAYLDLIRQHPPDQAPEKFALILEAYEKIKTSPLRSQFTLFDESLPGESPLHTVCQWARLQQALTPPEFPQLLSLLRQCSKI